LQQEKRKEQKNKVGTGGVITASTNIAFFILERDYVYLEQSSREVEG